MLCRTQEGGSDRVNDPAFPVTTLPPPQLKPYLYTHIIVFIYNNNSHNHIYAHKVAATAVTAAVVLIVEKYILPPHTDTDTLRQYIGTIGTRTHTNRNHRSNFLFFFSFPGHPSTIKTVSARV